MNDLILYIVESSLSLALFYSVYWIFLKKETYFTINRFFLIFSILFSFIVPLIHITSPFVSRQIVENPYILNQTTNTLTQSQGMSGILLTVYILGVGFFLFLMSYKFVKLFMLIKKSDTQRYNGLSIVFVEDDISPFSFFNLVFVNRSSVSDNDFKRIISHEMVHIKQFHSIDLIILELLTIFQWFNPFVWPYKKFLKETHEYLADNAVIAQGCDTAGYQLLIFEQHVGVKLFEFANNFNHSQIKRRITMMTKNKSKGWARFKALLILPMFLLLVLVFADSKTVRVSDQAKPGDGDKVLLAQEDSGGSTQADDLEKKEDKKKAEKKKKKDVAKKDYDKQKKEELAAKEKELRALLEKTKDPEKRKLIKEKLVQIQEMKGPELDGEDELALKRNKIKKIIAETEDPEKRAKLKEEYYSLQKKSEAIKAEKALYVKLKRLEEEIAKTDDPEKKAELKKKLYALEKNGQVKRVKIYDAKTLEKMLSETKDPEKKEKIKKMLEELKKKEAAKKKKE